MDPLITLDLTPWEDVNIDGSIGGTYLTTDVSEIVFDSDPSSPTYGEATINFCTDAQAVYFDFTEFNLNNPTRTLGFDSVTNSLILDGGIVPADPLLAPNGFTDGQILLDQGHCGSFKFKLKLSDFPEFPSVNFSGSICVRAGNIVKCFTFPAINMYDAHFIVGEPIFEGELFTGATTQGGNWLEVSRGNRLYNNSTGTSLTTAAAAQIYLHLDENLTGDTRTGSVTLTNGSVTKKINISQLSAIPVGRFGYSTNNSSTDVRTYDAGLFTEQLYEYERGVNYANVAAAGIPAQNFIYNGWGTAVAGWGTPTANIVIASYTNNFKYQDALYSAINYCAYKNRPATRGGTLTANDIRWYLPSQAQLMGMWTSYESHKDIATSTFKATDSLAYWSATSNSRNIPGANEAQYLNFKYGNVGHTKMHVSVAGTERWATRCVRNGDNTNYPTSGMITSGSPVTINFANGLPAESHNNTAKTANGTGTEHSTNNRTLFRTLRVASRDHTSPVKWDAATNCSGYTEGSLTSGWRLPTQRELQAIWILQSEIKAANPATFDLLKDDDYYWSATEASQTWNNSANKYTNAWVVFGSVSDPGGSGNTPHRNKEEFSRVRCVRE